MSYSAKGAQVLAFVSETALSAVALCSVTVIDKSARSRNHR
jgi:hypothetical protein